MLLGSTDADTSFLQEAEMLLTIIKVVVSLGVVTALTTTWRHFRHRRRWRNYKQLVDQWFPHSRLGLAEVMTHEEWQTLCETLLGDANINPFETQQLLTVAVTAAKGIMSARIWEP